MRTILILILFFNAVFFNAQTIDANGKKQGYFKKKDEKTNKLIYEGLFVDNKPQGNFKYYYPNDSIKAKMYFKQDGKTSYSTLFHPNGKKMAVGKYSDELKDSVWVYFDDAGKKISQETFIQGKKNGKALVFLPDGLVSEERNYTNDEQDGPFKLFYNKTQLKGEGNYIKGLLDGKNAYYFPNGTAAAIGYYKDGQKIGPWIYKDKDGKIKEKELYKNGKLASKKETDEFFEKTKTASEEVKSNVKKPKSKKVKK